MGENEFVEVAKVGSLFEARLLVGRLESEGIPARIPGESTHETLDGIVAIWKSGVPVEVPVACAAEAREALAAAASEPGDDFGGTDADDDQADA